MVDKVLDHLPERLSSAAIVIATLDALLLRSHGEAKEERAGGRKAES